MTLKSQVASLASTLEERAESLPAQWKDVRANVETWQTGVLKFARKNPALAVLGAFVVGFGLAKVARHA
jgi:hypothetical protein